ncbi:TetR/AcrR family transcriptional regulator [Nonomuraea cavernae]|uniref:TetR family transcriptional regulator n=1 Tax=Nonomuraea cavernae TaxID=2045107 RepID=A0A917YWI3_9ACTN|nr:TetR/AcrR family transcriptional regulator [Nonomuraea cavernae]MCA2187306.1 TetR/AcrR family transcriptional regulator [Nonomuraea cavernae]GGO68211.1 TetR family transcriptional regulator [Nonomuraea cavernae]
MNTAERLIQSTQQLLWERGYVGTSPKAIQQRAEAGQGSMYHHFTGKQDLALQAIRRSAEQLCSEAAERLSSPGTSYERIAAYLLRERDVLRGCRIGRLAADPDIVASPTLRAPLEETFTWLNDRIRELLVEGRERGEFSEALVPADAATAITAVVQGGYVLAMSAGTAEPFERAVRGALNLLTAHLTGGQE